MLEMIQLFFFSLNKQEGHLVKTKEKYKRNVSNILEKKLLAKGEISNQIDLNLIVFELRMEMVDTQHSFEIHGYV